VKAPSGNPLQPEAPGGKILAPFRFDRYSGARVGIGEQRGDPPQ
jgi:hypothetical protein